MKTTKGIYIHIPFCASKCTYCDFYSVAVDTELLELYTNALVQEIEDSASLNADCIIDTVYIGGGTPSVLPLNFLEKIISSLVKNFNLQLKEFTMEANPSSALNLKAYKEMGVNRLSLGVQTLNDKILNIIGRRHDSKTALLTLDLANEYFENLSCDLMLGLPMQTLKDVELAINTVASKVQHISTYMLKLSENVPMYKSLGKKLLTLPTDDEFVDFYDLAYSILQDYGFKRYEISNFSKPNFESLHNLKYWRRDEYIGLGASAHGFIGNVRYYNPSNLNDYISGVNYGKNKAIYEELDIETAIFEKIMLAFRLSEGLNVNEINNEFEIDFEKKYAKQLSTLSSFLEKKDNRFTIKEDKMLLESAIAREFLI